MQQGERENYGSALTPDRTIDATRLPVGWGSLVSVYAGRLTTQTAVLKCIIGGQPSAVHKLCSLLIILCDGYTSKWRLCSEQRYIARRCDGLVWFDLRTDLKGHRSPVEPAPVVWFQTKIRNEPNQTEIMVFSLKLPLSLQRTITRKQGWSQSVHSSQIIIQVSQFSDSS